MTDNEDIARRLGVALALIFAVGAVAIAYGTLTRRAPKRLWTIYFSEIVVIALIVVPAYIGPLAVIPAYLLLGAVCTRELCLTLRSAHLARTRAFEYLLGALIVLAFPVLGAAQLAVIACRSDGFGHIIWMYGVIELGDAGALVFGSVFGKRKIWPSLSPNKTVVGSVAGLLCAVAGALALRFAVPHSSTLRCVALGAGLAVAGQLADSVASAIKRRAGVKDFSSAVPAQGGVLDVYDSALLVAPLYSFLLGAFEAW